MIQITNLINTILIAEDDPEDRLLTQEAMDEATLDQRVQFVEDGEQLLAYLRREGIYCDSEQFPAPGIILLDLNMPRLDGRQALKEIKSDPELRNIPVVVLSTSCNEEDIRRTYALGVNSFITKPSNFAELVQIMKTIRSYWFHVVSLPEGAEK